MRAPAEILFRLRQEGANLALLLLQPGTSVPPPRAPLHALPDPLPVGRKLRGTPFAEEVHRLAQTILMGRVPLFDSEIETGAEIDWTRDYTNDISSPADVYFRRVPYLNFALVGDHKVLWELNRHQHLVVLAQAALIEDDAGYLREIERQLESWWAHNSFQRGMNWTSALEVAFRALSWIWVYHLAGNSLSERVRRGLAEGLYRHALHLEFNLSVYFSPNTHLLGEAVALHAINCLFPQLPGAARRRELGRRIVHEQMEFQVRPDGSHFEQSTYYHLYAVDFFLFHHLLEPAPAAYVSRLRTMAEYLASFVSPAGELPTIGDDDGGRLFHPYGPRAGFARSTLATCARVFPDMPLPLSPEALNEQATWWLGAAVLDKPQPSSTAAAPSRLFPDSGLAVMNGPGGIRVLIDAGPFGYGGAGHSHADTLSVVAWRADREILIDPGSYTYVASPEWRERFRGTPAHNTVAVDGADQATPAGPFRWHNKPSVTIHAWSSTEERDYLYASCIGRFHHRRRVVLVKGTELLVILDEVSGDGTGMHAAEQFWHLGHSSERIRFTCADPIEVQSGWRSFVPGSKVEAEVLRVSRSGNLPLVFATVVDLSANPAAAQVHFTAAGMQRRVELQPMTGGCSASILFDDSADLQLAVQIQH